MKYLILLLLVGCANKPVVKSKYRCFSLEGSNGAVIRCIDRERYQEAYQPGDRHD